MNKKVCSFPILFALLALLIGTCAVVFPASAQAAPTSTGSITVSGNVRAATTPTRSLAPTSSTATATPRSPPTSPGQATPCATPRCPCCTAPHAQFQTTAQEAAEWLNTDSHLTSALSAQLARSLQSSGAVSVALNAGTTAELPCGYWLIVADDDAISQNEAGTAPIMALVGGSAVTVKPKAATPRWPSTCWRTAPPPGRRPPTPRSPTTCTGASRPRSRRAHGLRHLYGAVRRHHERGARPSKVAASMRVYVAAGADGGFDAVSTGKDGASAPSPRRAGPISRPSAPPR
ncbi:MAG: hypothetical protein ACLTXI_10260 [Collinsella sp.]